MPHIVRHEPWGVIDIVLHEGRIFFQQDWYYLWQVRPPLAPWTYEEKRNFHNTADRQIWGVWSNRIRIPVQLAPNADSRARDFVSRTAGRVPINFDIRWVTRAGHYTVTVIKIPAGAPGRSWVNFGTRQITLHSDDLDPRGACTDTDVCTDNGFLTAPHEFGHTIQLPDEYRATSPHVSDTASIMNIGRQVRPRHLQLIVNTLNQMFPGCVFSLPAV
ncbi:MAG: hypothetical protein NZV14_18535 [Bryobacteraceae bacterium]|nr:hypothetical protein [Bryobacteraceae bacterium]MDW8380165.1 hypothetical protein [Bryobacterales bacterium]